MKIPYINTSTFLVFTWLDGTPRQVQSSHENFDKIVTLVKTSKEGWNGLSNLANELEELLHPAVRLERITTSGTTELSFNRKTSKLSCTIEGKEFPIPVDLANYVLALYEEEGDIQPLVNFITKMAKNPDKEVSAQIWSFISACGLCLTPDGNFLSYKNVNDDFTSIFDGKTDNSPGTLVQMDRKNVTKDPNRTCNTGLHFAAWGYLRYYSSGGKTVLVSTSPEHVVSIPSDYDNQKGRACEYRILREVARPEELKGVYVFTDD